MDHSLVLREDIVTNEIQHDLDNLGIAKTAREEKMRARDAKMKEQAENERMAKLYREHVLKEQPGPGPGADRQHRPPAARSARSHRPRQPNRVEEREEVGSFGD